MCQARSCFKCITGINSQLAHNDPSVNRGGIEQREATEPAPGYTLAELGFESRQPGASGHTLNHKIELP